MPPVQIDFVTSNSNKICEVRSMLEPTIQVRSRPLDLQEIQGSIEEVAAFKCRSAASQLQGPVLIEDTALCFNALNGMPGPYIKWFLSAIGLEGLNNLLAAYADKSAVAVCTFAYSPGPGHQPIFFKGCCPGKIVPPRGPSKFGWDPIFEHGQQTFAEMGPEQKNKLSHRARALEKLQIWFKQSELRSL